MKQAKTIAFATLGCKLNFSETSAISRAFAGKGFTPVDFRDVADVYVINTCSVTENAEKKCKAAIKQAAKRNPQAAIAVVGCFAQLKPADIIKIKGVSIVLGTSEKFRLPDILNDYFKNKTSYTETGKVSDESTFIPSYSVNDRTRSFFKIQDGCDYHCAYCTVPLARGRSRSGTIASTMSIARDIALTDVKELVLTGVNVGDFGKPHNQPFSELLRQLDTLKGIERIRISSIEPDLLTDEIIERVAASDKFLPHFHIPLQSGCDKVLKLMHRRYNTALFTEKIEKIKQLMPFCCVALDVIVGFPGETDEDFQTTYQFLESVPVSYMHVFTYSERENTKASAMHEKVPPAVRKQRSIKLHQLSEKKKRHFYRQNIGRRALVLFESDNVNGFMQGFTENYIKVKTPFNPSLINQIIPVSLTHLEKDCIFAVGPVLQTS